MTAAPICPGCGETTWRTHWRYDVATGETVHRPTLDPDVRPAVEVIMGEPGRVDHLGFYEYDSDGQCVRSAVLAVRHPDTAEAVFRRQCADIVRLMGDNVRQVRS